MLRALLLVLVFVIVSGGTLRALSWLRRERVLRRVPADAVRHVARGLSLRVVCAEGAFPGMTGSRAHRTRGDLLLTDDRILLVSSRGVLIDERADSPRRLTAVRAPAPDRLVLEGVRPTPGGDAPFRIELVLGGAREWAHRIASR